MRGAGKVYLIGAGPGDPDLLTVKAVRLIKQADIVVYDRLVSDEILALIPRKAARLSVGKEPGRHPIPQAEINRLLVRLAGGGLSVARLKGGDPFIFGRGSEEAQELVRAGISYDIVPGITAAQGCAAQARIPLTHRGLATGLRFVTGHCRDDEPLDLDWRGLADPNTTLVIYMGCAQIRQIAARLIEHGLSEATPVLAVANATCANERQLRSDLMNIVDDLSAAQISNPVAFIVGEVAGLDLDAAEQVGPRLRLIASEPEAIHG